MANNSKIRQIYTTLKGGGADVGTEQEFSGWFFAKGEQGYKNRKQVYDTLKGGGADVGVNYEEFRDWLGLHPKQSITDRRMRGVEELKQGAQNIIEGNKKRNDNIRKYHNKNPYNQSLLDIGGTKQQGALHGKSAVTDMQYNPNSERFERKYITEMGNEYSNKIEADYEQQNIDELYEAEKNPELNTRRNLESLANKVDEAFADYSQNKVGALSRGVYYGQGIGMNASNSDLTWQTLATAKNALSNAQKIVREADEGIKSGNWAQEAVMYGKGVWRGFKDGVFDVNTWFDNASANEKRALNAAIKAADEGKLTEEQRMLLDAKAIELAVNSYFGSKVGLGYKVGDITAQSIPFMIEMYINPARAIGKGLAAKMIKYTIKRFAPKLLAKISKTATKAAVKGAQIGAKAVGDVAGAYAMAGTTGLPRTIADAQDRMRGDIVMGRDSRNNIVYGGHTQGEDAVTAFGKALTASAIENYTEMSGSTVGNLVGGATKRATSVGAKLADKLGLKTVSQVLGGESVGKVGKLAKLITDFEDKTQWHGSIDEYLEEVDSNVLNALLVGDMTLDTDEETGAFNPRLNLETALGVSLFGGALSALKTIGYKSPKKQAIADMDKADKRAAEIYGGVANWSGIRNTIAFGGDQEVKDVLNKVFSDRQLTREQKAAALDYAKQTQRYKGVLQGEKLKETDAKVRQLDAAYANGYNLVAAEDMQQAKDRLEVLRQSLSEFVADEKMQQFDNEPLIALYTIRDNEQWTNEEKQAALDYVNAKATYDGMLQKVRDDIDSQIAVSDEIIDSRTASETIGGDGMVHPATLKSDNKKVFIVNGNVVTLADGTIDVENSDNDLIIVDENGVRDFTSVNKLRSVDAVMDAEQMKQEAADNIRESVSNTAAAKIDGSLSFLPNDVYEVVGEDGQLHKVQVLQQIDEENVSVVVDGQVEKPVTMSKGEIQDMYDAKRRSNLKQERDTEERDPFALYADVTIKTPDGDVRGTVITAENEDGLIEVQTDTPIDGKSVVQLTRQQLEEMNAPQKQESVEAEEDVIPQDAKGNPDYLSVTPERAYTHIYTQSGLKPEYADKFVDANIAAAQKELDKAKNKKEPDATTGLREYQAQLAEWESARGEAQAKLDFWNNVKAQRQAVDDAARAEQLEKDKQLHDEAVKAEAQRIEEEKKKQEEREAIGANNIAPSIRDKWNNADKVVGRQDFIVLPNGERLQGHYVLTDAFATTPSHDPLQGFVKTDGFPFDENEQTVNDRDYERDSAAQSITKEMGSHFDARALQRLPIISSVGVDYSGNGTDMAHKLAAHNGTDNEYNEVLRGEGKIESYGISKEDLSRFEHPTIVFQLDEDLPYTAETFAKFNQQEMKSQNKTEQAVKLGKVVSDGAFSRIIRLINGYDTLGEFYADNKATRDALSELLKDGAFNQMQYTEMFDGDSISVQGRDMLENMLIGKAFEKQPDAVRQITTYKSIRQAVVTALAELSNNIALGDDYQISDEIIQAIDLVYQARGKGYNYGDRVSDFARQLNLFPNEDGESVADYNNALVMLLSDILNDKRVTRLKKFLELYNHNSALSAAGQLDIFTGNVKAKEDIIKEVLQLLDYGTEEEQQQASAEAREQLKQSVANTQGDSSEEVSNSNESNEGDGPKGKLATDIREQQRREQIQPNLGGKYSLSQEKANNGEVFYQNENGNTTLAIIPDKIFDRLGIKPIPFKLTETMGWHVFDHHKKEAKFNNIGDAIDFVLSIINNVDHVRLGRDNTYIFSVENGRSRVGKRAVTIMINSEIGEFMGIRTSGYETLGKLIERPLLWERGADFVPEDVATPTITTIESQQGDETSSRAKSQSNDVSADKDKTSSANKQENEEKSVIQGLENYTENELLDAIRGDIETKLEEAGISDVTIKGMALNGSRLRGDAKQESDLDVVVEYEGDMSEDGLFNILNEDPITIEGIKVDINPITKGKSGTLDEYMKRSRAYDEYKNVKPLSDTQLSEQPSANAEVETYHIGDQFEIIDKDGNPNLCRITGVDADGNIEIVAGGLGHSYKESVTPSTLDMYRERKLDYDTRNEMRYFISNVVDDEDVTFVNKITTEELKKFKHLVDVWDELPDGTKDKKESYDEVEDYITQLRKAYPVGENGKGVTNFVGKFKSNEFGVCINPNVIEEHKEKNNSTSGYKIYTAETDKGWTGGYSVIYNNGGVGTPVMASENDRYFKTEDECRAYWAQRALDYITTNAKSDKKMSKYIPSLEGIIGKVRNIEPNEGNTAPNKSANEEGKLREPEVKYHKASEGVPVYYSNAQRAVEGIKQEKATPEQWLKMIEKAGGLKAGEDKWLGLSDFLKSEHDKKTLTKDEVLDFIRENMIQIEEVEYGENRKAPQEIYDKFNEYLEDELSRIGRTQMEDAADNAWGRMRDEYGDDIDIAFTLWYNKNEKRYEIDIDNAATAESLVDIPFTPINSTRLDYTTEGLENKREIALTVPTIESWNEDDEIHFGDAGEGRAVAWVRFGDTTDEDGNKVLVIDEIQSKRHQEGREKGYAPGPKEATRLAKKAADDYRAAKTEEEKADAKQRFDYYSEYSPYYAKGGSTKSGIPDAPFDKNWHELAMKRMLRFAAENGYDKVAWTTGAQQADRYDIRNVVEDLYYKKNEDGTFNISVQTKDSRGHGGGRYDDYGVQTFSNQSESDLSNLLGKETTQKIIEGKGRKGYTHNGETGWTTFKGKDLKIGGEGMKGFYDKMLPSFMNKYGKKWGVKVGEVTLPNVEESARKMWSVDVTPEMKESVMQGQPMFLRGGATELTPQEVALRDAIVDLMDSYGQRVITDDVMGQSVIDYVNGEDTPLSKAQKRAVETATLSDNTDAPLTVVSTADGAKILNNLNELANHYDNLTKNNAKTFLGKVAKALEAKNHGSNSQYATFETKNGNIVTIRLANHNAKVSTFDKNDEDNGISIVVSKRANEGITNDGNAHVVEYYYPETGLRRAEGKPLADIVRAIQQSLYSGEFKDPTGIAERQEVNEDNIREMRVYHGSAADFDAFDHSHMGEGEGAQAYGWGSYVTEVEGIGKTYAEATAGKMLYKDAKVEADPYSDNPADRAMFYIEQEGDANRAVKFLKELIRDEEDVDTIREYKETINVIQDKGNWKRPERILYTVEVPDETESYYIDYKGRMGDQNGILDMVDNSLAADGWKRQEIDSRIKFTKDGMQIILTPNQSGADLYAELSDALGSDKAASEFLHSVGITGIKFPAEYRSGGREDGASNYVIFDENDLKITDKAKFFRTPEGEVYGFTYKGDIYIDPRVATAETPIHEYAHLWVGALKKANPKAWETLKNRMEGMSDVMEYVKGLYPELEGDDLLEEVFTHYSGKRGAERLREEQKAQTDAAEGIFNKASVIAMFEKLRGLLKDFWNKARDLFAGKVEGVEDMSGEDFADMMLGDLLGGFIPDGGGDKAKYARKRWANSNRTINDNVLYRDGKSIEDVNDRFNEELQKQIDGELPANHIYNIGMPSDILLSTGFPNIPIELSASHLLTKANTAHHPFDIGEMKDLVKALQSPIAVFAYGDKNKSQNAIVEIQHDDKNFVVGIHFNQKRGRAEVSSIRGLYPKDNAEWLNWVNQGKLLYVDKNKIQTLINQQRRNLADVEYLDLDSAAKVIENFENPKISTENFREGDETPYMDYEEKLKDSRRRGYTKQQLDRSIERHVRLMRERAEETVGKLGIADNVTILEDNTGLEGRKAKAKGWYDTKSGKIVVVLGNHGGVSDVVKTILHEGVAHYGLRQLFGENFNTFLDNVYKRGREEVKQRIDELAKKYDGDIHTATEEYLAELAESTDFERPDLQSWWRQIKRWFLDMLDKVGLKEFDGELSDNELRYILWRSYENLAEPNRYNNVFATAKDIAKQYELGVGNFAAESMVSEEEQEQRENNILFRDDNFSPRDRQTAREVYNDIVASGRYQFKEAMQDSMLGLKELYKAVLGRGIKIEDVAGNENAYLAENRMSSVNAAEQHQFYNMFLKPLLSAIHDIAGSDKAARQELTDYMMAKHGLERNRKFAERDARAAENDGKDFEEEYKQNRKRDYAGLTALTGIKELADAEAEAARRVQEYESKHDTTKLWNCTKDATHTILAKLFQGGLLSKDNYNNISTMFDYYIPLQGFDEKTSDEVYGYLTSKNGLLMGSPVKKAEGRSSKADDPIATIAMMADTAIRQANRNKMKQTFLNFVLNNPSDLVSVNKLWLQYNDVSEEWEPVFADIKAEDTAEEVNDKVAAFEDRMKKLAEQNPDKYKRGADTKNIPYRVLNNNLREHQVLVKRNGETYVLTINGNPRAAQALNGLTNPDVEINDAVGTVLKAFEWLNRQLSAVYTTRNPDFVASNFFRDMLYSNCMTWVKESPKYAIAFNTNFTLVNPMVMLNLFRKWESGKLNENNKIEKLFGQFMANGGETGFTTVKDIEAHKRSIANELKRQSNALRQFSDVMGMQFDIVNKSVENCARFAAFVTSRDFGRSIERSIYDAKEVSVNFNKKGAGGKMMNAVGQTFFGKYGGSFISGMGRLAFVFWNAGIQGMTNFGRAGAEHPLKASVAATTLFALGAAMPYIAMLMSGGDDDDKNAYYNLPEYIRRSNICINAGDQWITIPLPIEFRAVYGLGELAYGVLARKERYSDGELAKQVLSQVSQLLPIDFMEGGGGWQAITPSAIKPVVEVLTNTSWTGLPIYKENPFNENEPEYTQVYKNTDKYLVAVSKYLNELSGGDDVSKGWLDVVNPAQVEYVLNGYFGGFFKVPTQLVKMVETAVGERDFDWRNMIIANRLLKTGDERTEARKLTEEYFKYSDELKKFKHDLKGYEKDADSNPKHKRALEFLKKSEDYKMYEVFENYRPLFDAYHKAKQGQKDDRVRAIEQEENILRREMVDLMHAIEDDKNPNIDKSVDDMLKREFEYGGIPQKSAGQTIAKRLGGTDSYGNAKGGYSLIYNRMRDYTDLAQDVILQTEEKKAKESGDTERAKRIAAARREVTSIKKDLAELPFMLDDGTEVTVDDVMETLRDVRNEYLQELGINKGNR